MEAPLKNNPYPHFADLSNLSSKLWEPEAETVTAMARMDRPKRGFCISTQNARHYEVLLRTYPEPTLFMCV